MVSFYISGGNMEKNKINENNYILILGFMINDLKLKGNELLIYAIIYGFSQTENQTYKGSLQYLADWTNSTKQGVIKCLKSLIDKGYIEKKEQYLNGVKFCEYHTTKFNGVLNKVEWGGKQSLTNNTNNNTCSSSYNNKKELWEIFEENLGRPIAPIEFAKIQSWEDDINRELIEYALEIAILNHKRSINYIDGILRNWRTAGYKTKQEVKESEKTISKVEETSQEELIDEEMLNYDWLEEGE
jgi:DnaD/phage-associated family protein